jgi:hypothetical protein
LNIKKKQLEKQKASYKPSINKNICSICSIKTNTKSMLCNEHKSLHKASYAKEYRKLNHHKISTSIGQWKKIQYSSNLDFRLRTILRSRLNSAIKNNQKTGSAVKDLGCNIEELKLYLEAKFHPGMSWENYGKGSDKWNIDHIIPLVSFDLTNREELLKACHYTNLQPLWELDNITKGGNIV